MPQCNLIGTISTFSWFKSDEEWGGVHWFVRLFHIYVWEPRFDCTMMAPLVADLLAKGLPATACTSEW